MDQSPSPQHIVSNKKFLKSSNTSDERHKYLVSIFVTKRDLKVKVNQRYMPRHTMGTENWSITMRNWTELGAAEQRALRGGALNFNWKVLAQCLPLPLPLPQNGKQQTGNKQQQQKSKRAKDEREKKKSEICTPVCGSVTAVLRPQISNLHPPSTIHHPPSSDLHLHCQMPNAVCSSVPLGACVIMHVSIDILQREKWNSIPLHSSMVQASKKQVFLWRID